MYNIHKYIGAYLIEYHIYKHIFRMIASICIQTYITKYEYKCINVFMNVSIYFYKLILDCLQNMYIFVLTDLY